MDQDSFRQLLQTPVIPNATPQPKGTKGASLSKQKSSEPKFKPRKVKTESQYRDRAAERRAGGKGDYAQVEAVLEIFEQRTANDNKETIGKQRQYLGGDSEHTILVKGLDVSLLEQNKARAAASTEDDDTLEQAFLEASSEPAAPNKRTREDIIRELKAKRNSESSGSLNPTFEVPPEDDASKLEKAGKAGKFKPIGFKPIGVQNGDKGGKKRSKEDNATRRKKKRKVEGIPSSSQPANAAPYSEVEQPVEQQGSGAEASIRRLPSPPAEDIDIFAGVGDYQGFVDDNDSDEHDSDPIHKTKSEHDADLIQPRSARGWFGDDRDDETSRQLPAPAEDATQHSPPVNTTPQVDEEEGALRLKPLETSALPSISDFLAMDAAAEKEDKKRARREKRKNKKKSDGIDDDD